MSHCHAGSLREHERGSGCGRTNVLTVVTDVLSRSLFGRCIAREGEHRDGRCAHLVVTSASRLIDAWGCCWRVRDEGEERTKNRDGEVRSPRCCVGVLSRRRAGLLLEGEEQDEDEEVGTHPSRLVDARGCCWRRVRKRTRTRR